MKEKKFKYGEEIKRIPSCPPSSYKEIEKAGFRFIKEDIYHPDNFKPVQKIQPNRKFKNDESLCLSYGLSMFSEKEKAISFYQNMHLKFPRFYKLVGEYIATVLIDLNDGVSSEPEELNFGHFTFHEYIWCDFHQKILSTDYVKPNP